MCRQGPLFDGTVDMRKCVKAFMYIFCFTHFFFVYDRVGLRQGRFTTTELCAFDVGMLLYVHITFSYNGKQQKQQQQQKLAAITSCLLLLMLL